MPDKAAIRRATFAAHQHIETLDAKSAADLQDIYRQAAADIARQIQARAGEGDVVGIEQLQDLLSAVKSRLQQLSSVRDQLLGETLGTAAQLGTKPFAGVLDASAAIRVNESAVNFVRSFVAEDGLRLSDRIWRIDRGARETVTKSIESAVIQGYGAAQAAREFLGRGQPIPLDTRQALQGSGARKLGHQVSDQLLTGEGNPLANSMRLFRTELNRAHGEAYTMGGANHPDFAGWRYLLSPAHPRPDICDLLSRQNVHGLGGGVYPSRETCPWPAHPNTLSFLAIVFKDEVTDADRKGIETPMQALAKLTPEQREGVLGKNKNQAYEDGKLSQGMIRAPWKAVQQRIGIDPPAPIGKPHSKPTLALDDYLKLGATKADELLARAAQGGPVAERLSETLWRDLNTVRSTARDALIKNGGRGAEMVKAASRLFPDDWTKAADDVGPLYVRAAQERGWQLTLSNAYEGKRIRYKGFEFVSVGGDGMIVTDSFQTAVHEYTHRLQAAMPGLDAMFQELHHRRTAGDPLRLMRDLYLGSGYGTEEVAREDKYVTPYQGKIYSGANLPLGRYGAMEVITVAFEYVLGNNPLALAQLLAKDREMFDLVIGTLYHYVP